MVALAGIGAMPDTITDRAINITMRRRTGSERVAQFRCRRDEPVLHRLRDRLAVWAQAHIGELAVATPELPVEDRAADTWEPLVAVADAAGGQWPALARRACVAMVAGADDVEENRSLDIRLLYDIRQVFTDKAVPFLASNDLVDALKAVTESPWRDFDYTASKLAHRLAPFGVNPGHSIDKKVRGYRLEWFHDAFDRYLRPEPSGPSQTGTEQVR
ncbi:putative prophage protein [Mycolicibacterium aichiense]|nr:putative prophage protein [Mycolicibacterium aichiense]